MSPQDVEYKVRMIEDHKHDDELAHAMEDGLWFAVLKTISEGAPNAPALAALALKSRNIDFSRWYA